MLPAASSLVAFDRRPARAFGAWIMVALFLTLWTGHAQAQATNSLTPEGATSFISDADLNNTNIECNQDWDATYQSSRQQALEVQLANDNRLFKYAVSGAYAAQCTNRLIDYVRQLQGAVKSIQSAAQAGDPAKAALTLIANQIIESVFNQLFSSLMSQVCTITKDVTSAANSVLQNAICLPGVNLGIGSVFNFDVSLNLPNLTCDGVAINPIGYFDVNPQTGVSTLNGGALSASIAGGVYSGADTYSVGDEDMPIGFRPDDSGDIYGEPEPMQTGWDTVSGGASVGAVCTGGGGIDGFLAALANSESGSGTSGQCQNLSRVGLSGTSRSPYTCVNSSGFVGKYQFGEAALHDLAKRGIVPSAFGSCQPWPSHDCYDNRYGNTSALAAFLADPAAQEKAIRAEVALNWSVMEKRGVEQYIGRVVNGVTLTKSGLLAAAHLIGASGVMNALATGRLTADGNGVSWLTYASRFSDC